MYLRQNYVSREPQISLGNGDEPGLEITLAEAEAIAHGLLKLVASGRGVTR